MADPGAGQGPARAGSGATSLRQAADWYATLRSEGATPADRLNWRQWLDASPEHQAAWKRVESVGLVFAPLSGTAQRTEISMGLEAASRGRASRRHLLKTLGLGSATVASAWVASRSAWWTHASDTVASWSAGYRTATGEMRRVALPSGGAMWLNTASAAVSIDSATQRGTRLLRGEILVETGTDARRPARPFVVEAGGWRMRALGTRFSVRERHKGIELAVFDGAVELPATSGAGSALVVHAGRQVRWSREGTGGPGLATAVDPNRAAWTRGILLADAMRLDAFIAELSPYWEGHLGCDDAVAQLLVTGAFPLTDHARIAAMLTAALPVRFHAPMPWWTTIEAR